MRVTKPEQKYINEVFGLKDPDLERIREQMRQNTVEGMSISGAEARILQFLIRSFNVRRVLEVGTLFGYSACAMARALPADGYLITLEKNPKNFAIAQENFREFKGLSSPITSLCGAALDLLPSIENRGPFDLIFIDADKGAYIDYLNWAEKNVRPGGLIIGDNTFLFGALWGESQDPNMGERQISVMREFNSRLADTTRYNSVLIPTAEGMTIAQKL